MGLLTATRPWSFTAGVVPVAFTAVLQDKPLLSAEVLRMLGLGVFTQAGANLVNTFVDFKHGVDTKDDSGDRGIVDGHVSTSTALPVAALCFGAAAACGRKLLSDPAFFPIYAAGTALSVAYTAPPISLKYRRLGDVCIFVCFGPLLMQASSIAFTGKLDPNLNAYSIPVGLLTECILWANNTRDIESDTKAMVRTMCNLLGYESSRTVYKAMTYLAYLSSVALAVSKKHPGLLAPLLTLPIAVKTCSDFKPGKEQMRSADERAAQLHLPFGLLLILGVLAERRFGRATGSF